MFPSVVHSFQSDAESKVFDLLAATDLGSRAFALHSLNLSKHERKRWAELDFVVAWEQGIYVLEVKGGRVACSGGIWSFTNRNNETNQKSEGPFDQAKSGHDALRKYLKGQPHERSFDDFCWGWGVIFPSIPFDMTGPSWSANQVADRRTISGATDLGSYLRRLASWWRSQGRGHRSLADANDLDALRTALRPDFDKVPSLASSLDDAMDTIVRMTDEQLTALDAIEENERILCTGGAGTGKTFLAAEAARREAALGRTVILVCRSPALASFLRNRIGNTKVTVADLDSAAAMAIDGRRFDCVIIDEAQDLMSELQLARISPLMTKGLSSGRWRMFLDPNNQSGLHEPTEPALLQRLRGQAALHRLKRNCRNTKQIVLQTQLHTGADIGEAVIEGQGPPIERVEVGDERSQASLLENRIAGWLDEGVRPGHITVLSPRPLSSSAARLLPSRLQLQEVTQSVAGAWPSRQLTYSTIRGFKGLENRCVAVVDLEQFDGSEQSVAELYVAMTRANACLWMAVPQGRKEILDGLVRKHTQQMLSQASRQ